ncbi:MAG: ABC transporter permease [Pseudomonadota bacterium]
MAWASPVIALALTLIFGMLLFAVLGVDPLRAVYIIFVEPLTTGFGRAEMVVKGTPLVLIAIGLSLGFRAGVWNIGAEGQLILGALAGTAAGLAVYPAEGLWVLPMMCLAGMAAGAAWAMIPAVLRIRFGANEILVSLMLVYVADLWLSVLVSGPLRDPDGFNFPETRLFTSSMILPPLFDGTRAHMGALAALAAVVIAWAVLRRHVFGFSLDLFGQAPRAAAFAGFSEARTVALTLGIGGALAGLAGVFEASLSAQLKPSLPVGYGFTAIIVAFLGRLHPVGILAGGALMALTYIGGEGAQLVLRLPAASISVFQGMLLFFLLGADVLTRYRLKPAGARTAPPDPAGVDPLSPATIGAAAGVVAAMQAGEGAAAPGGADGGGAGGV